MKPDHDYNIFHFGDSLSDPGNLPYEIGTKYAPKSRDVSSPDGDITFHLRVSKMGTFSDGHTFAYFLAEKLHFNYLKGSTLTNIPYEEGNYINFALGGASQDENIGVVESKNWFKLTPGKHFGSFIWQINTFERLLHGRKGKHFIHNYKVKPNDLFMYMFVGANDLFIIFDHYLEKRDINIPNSQNNGKYNNEIDKILEKEINEMIQKYVEATVNNLDRLYKLGMRNLILGTLDDISFTILAEKYEKMQPGSSSIMQAILTNMQERLHNAINDKFSLGGQDHLNLNITFISLNDVLEDPVFENADKIDSLAETNYWPVNSKFPIMKSDDLLFSDDVHPTESAHKLTAEVIFNLIFK